MNRGRRRASRRVRTVVGQSPIVKLASRQAGRQASPMIHSMDSQPEGSRSSISKSSATAIDGIPKDQHAHYLTLVNCALVQDLCVNALIAVTIIHGRRKWL